MFPRAWGKLDIIMFRSDGKDPDRSDPKYKWPSDKKVVFTLKGNSFFNEMDEKAYNYGEGGGNPGETFILNQDKNSMTHSFACSYSLARECYGTFFVNDLKGKLELVGEPKIVDNNPNDRAKMKANLKKTTFENGDWEAKISKVEGATWSDLSHKITMSRKSGAKSNASAKFTFTINAVRPAPGKNYPSKTGPIVLFRDSPFNSRTYVMTCK